jgi:uncharacterized MAPEG superfamily protein
MASPTIALWCLFIAALMPYFVVAIAKSSKAYDNEDPRNMGGFQTPLRRRAHGAHQNCFEAFGLFAMAVLVALLEKEAPAILNGLALLWIFLRLVYVAMYLAGRGALRTMSWFAASFTSIGIFLIAIVG